MAGISLEARVVALERHVSELATKDDVRELGEQFLQLRAEIHVDLQALRQEIRSGEERLAGTLREEMRAADERLAATLREEMRAADERLAATLREEMRAGDEETRRVLREEIRAGDEETRRFMLVLHEEVIDRLKRLSG